MARPARFSASLLAVSALTVGAFVFAKGADPDPADAAPMSNPEAAVVTIPRAAMGPMMRAGVTPEALAAVGVHSEQLGAFLTDAADPFLQAEGAFAQADTQYADAKRSRDGLARKVKSGTASSEEVQALAQAKSDLAAREQARNTRLDSLFTAATANLTAPKAQALSNIRQNAHWKLPTEFLVVNRTEAEWVQLRDALADEEVAAKLGLDPNPQLQAVLAAARTNAAVAEAKANLDSRRDALKAAWQSTFTD